jgi:hypothetical protein
MSGAVGDWANFKAMFDQYKVTGIRIRFDPAEPYGGDNSLVWRPVYIFKDVDTTEPFEAISTIQGRKRKIVNLYKPFKIYMKAPKYTSIDAGIFDTDLTMTHGGWMNTMATDSATWQAGMINILGQNLSTLSTYGTLDIRYYVLGKGRK